MSCLPFRWAVYYVSTFRLYRPPGCLAGRSPLHRPPFEAVSPICRDPNVLARRRGTVTVGQRVGYVRISTVHQNRERQLDGIVPDRMFTDKASGKDTKRLELDALLAYVRHGDTVVVHSMDRLAHSLEGPRWLARELTGRGVRVEFIKEALTFTGEDTPMTALFCR